jgi:DnaJ-domain-containing protein 1
VSITRRILESAQSGLSRLTSLVIVDDEPLSYVESSALQNELTARKASRERSKKSWMDNPLAKQALPSGRSQREAAARNRSAKIHRERDEREAKQRAAADEAFRKMKEQAARGGGSWSTGSSSSTSSAGGSSSSQYNTGAGSARAPRPGTKDAELAEWYKILDLGPGADMSQIKTSYRQLMRKYHPDMHAGSPQKQKAATELSMRVTTAYNGLVAHLEKK